VPKEPNKYGPEYILNEFYKFFKHLYDSKPDYIRDLAEMFDTSSLGDSSGYYKYIKPDGTKAKDFKEILIRYRNASDLKLENLEMKKNKPDYYSAFCAVIELIKSNFPDVSLPFSILEQYKEKPLNGFIEVLLYSYGSTIPPEPSDEYIIVGSDEFFHSLFSEADTIKTIKVMGKSLNRLIVHGRLDIFNTFEKCVCEKIEIILINPKDNNAMQELKRKSRSERKAESFKIEINETLERLELIVRKTKKTIEIGFLPFIPYFGYFFVSKGTQDKFYIEIFQHNPEYKNVLLKLKKSDKLYKYHFDQYDILWNDKCQKEKWSWDEIKNDISKEKL